MITDSRGHRRRHAERFVNAPKVVPAIPKHHSRAVVFPLLAEAIRQPSEPAKAHPKREIRTLHYRSANTFRVRVARDWDHLHGSDLGGRVAGLPLLRGAIDLDELGEAGQPIMERCRDRGAVRCESIGGDLERCPRSRVPQAFHECIGGGLVAASHRDVEVACATLGASMVNAAKANPRMPNFLNIASLLYSLDGFQRSKFAS